MIANRAGFHPLPFMSAKTNATISVRHLILVMFTRGPSRAAVDVLCAMAVDQQNNLLDDGATAGCGCQLKLAVAHVINIVTNTHCGILMCWLHSQSYCSPSWEAGCMGHVLFTSPRLGAQLDSCAGVPVGKWLISPYFANINVTVMFINRLSLSMSSILFSQTKSLPTPTHL